jgi:hypothetical protein
MHAWKGCEPPSERETETGPSRVQSLFFATRFSLHSFSSIFFFRAVQGSSMPVDPKANTVWRHRIIIRRPPSINRGRRWKVAASPLRLNPHGAEAGFGHVECKRQKSQ